MIARSARLLVALLAAACCACPAQAQAPPRPVVIGAAVSQTGYLADLALGMRNALLLWQAQVNAGGGLLGRQVDLRLYDDASDSLRSTQLYEVLIKDDGAEALIGPFGSAATSIAAAVAERSRHVMLNATGTSPAIHKRIYRWLFQVPLHSDRVADGVLQLAAGAGLKSLLVVARDEAASVALVSELRAAVTGQGGRPGLLPAAYYTPDALKGLSAFAAGLKARGVDAVVTPAGPRDTAELLRGFKAAGYMPGLFVARGATSSEFIKLVGMDAEGTAGFSSYEARAATSGNAAFVKAYRDKYQRDPDFHAACGWAAGMVLEAAVRKAGSFEQERLRQALSALDIGTVLGAYKVAADGSQVAATPFLVQIQKGRRAVIWPAAFRSAVPVLPTPAWSNRSLKP